MIELSRRQVLRSAALAAGAALGGAGALLERARAWAADMPFQPEPGASLRALRWTPALADEGAQLERNVAAFSAATGIDVRLDSEFIGDIEPKAAAAANVGAGPDLVWGLDMTPHLFREQLLDLSDVARHLGERYGGWYPIAETYGRDRAGRWICLPACVHGNAIGYRQSWLADAGFERFPATVEDFLKLGQELHRLGHPGGLALGHASADANAWVHWLIWAFGGRLVDAQGEVAINSRETVAALEYARELYPTFAPGSTSWIDSSNDKAFLAGELGYTNGDVAIYAAARSEGLSEIAADMSYAPYPLGPDGEPAELQVALPWFAFGYSRYPNACKALLAFLLEAPQYEPWLAAAAGTCTQTLQAYTGRPAWQQDPKLQPFANACTRGRSSAFAGAPGYAAARVLEEFVLVDMVAAAATGLSTPEEAAAEAERRANRYYRV